jgi:ribosomal protein L5
MKPYQRATQSFVLNFFLLNKFHFKNGYSFPIFDKVVINTFIQDLDNTTSSYYPRSLSLVENLTSRKSIIKSIKKTLKGKKSYQVVASHVITLRKEFLYNFLFFFVYFATKGMEEKFLRFNRKLNSEGNYYLRIKDVTALPGLDEEFFRWPYSLDCFFLINQVNEPVLSQFFLKYVGFSLV